MPHHATPGRLVSVQVGTPVTYQWLGRTLSSSIAKTAVEGQVRVGPEGLEGDEQADPAQHGGPDKAVYAYASEDYDWWSEQLGKDVPPSTFGENLTTQGLDLARAVIGSRWHIGSVVLEVSEPRTPCWKLGRAMGDAAFPRAFASARRSGVLLRTIATGTLQVADTIEVHDVPSHAVTATDVLSMYYGDPIDATWVLGAPQLAEHWRTWAGHRTVWHLDEETRRRGATS